MGWQMKKIIDFIQPFNEFELEVNEFNFKKATALNIISITEFYPLKLVFKIEIHLKIIIK